MSILAVPISNNADAEQVTSFEGVEYTIRTRYNQREDAYYIDIGDTSGALLLAGVKLVPQRGLIRRYRNPELPPGELYVYSADGETPRRDAFGDSATLWYITSDEL
jgi:hypothetical protein